MKKVLVTGAAGSIGLCVIKYLLSEGKYDITAIDLPNKKSYNNLKKYHKRIKVIYGDLLDRNLVDDLVKNQDYILHLATCLPPYSETNKKLSTLVDYTSTENIVRAINYYNKKCFLIYASSTSVYNNATANKNTKINIYEENYYDTAKISAEKYINNNLKHYAILRTSLVIGDFNKNEFIYTIKKDQYIECISKEDAAYAFVKAIALSEKINKKILNIGGGDSCTINYKELLINILRYHGFSLKYFWDRIFMPKNYKSPILTDSDKSNEILNYQNDSIDSILMKIKRKGSKRFIGLLIGRIITFFSKKD